MRRRQWHPSQTIKSVPGGIELVLEVRGTVELKSWVLGFGSTGHRGVRSGGGLGYGSRRRGRGGSGDSSRGGSRRLFLLAASGQGDGGNQGSQNERLVHV